MAVAAFRRSTPTPVQQPSSRRRGRIEWLLLRWQARLDARWVDRVLPWAVAGIAFAVYFGVAGARAERFDAGASLARHVQGVWHLANLDTPTVTVGGEGDILADRLPLVLLPLGLLARVVPISILLLSVQAAGLALGAVPLWHLARKVAALRIGAAAALVLAYALHPAVADLDLGDFHPASLAMTPLLGMAYFAERASWRWFTVCAALAVSCASELGLVVAALGLLLVLERQRAVGARIAAIGFGYCAIALLLLQAALGRTGLVGPAGFAAYGDDAVEVLIELVRNPLRPLGDMLSQGSTNLVAWVLGPLVFLPLLALRKLLPALPLLAVYLVADVPLRGADGGGRLVPFLAFSFVAATFGLARLGRRSLDRVLVDRRVLGLLVAASVVGCLASSPLSPYQRPWRTSTSETADDALVLTRIPPGLPARVPESLAPDLAERAELYVLEDSLVSLPNLPGPRLPSPYALARGVDVLVVDYTLLEGGATEAGADALEEGLRQAGMVEVRRTGRLGVYLRLDRTDDEP